MNIFVADIATTTGCADGPVGGTPRLWSWDLRDAGEGRPERLAHLSRFLEQYFADFPVDEAYCEAPLRISAFGGRLAATEETILLLRGAIGIFESCASNAGVKVIGMLDPKDARMAICGRSSFPKPGDGKRATMGVLRALGWQPENLDESDAAGLWLYAAAQHDPRVLLPITPLMRAQAMALGGVDLRRASR